MGKNRLLDALDATRLSPVKRRPLLCALIIGAWAVSGCAHIPRSVPPNEALSPGEHMTLGNTYLAQGEKNLAAIQYQIALRQDRAYVPALVALGNMAFDDQRWETARTYFEKAHKAAPKDAAVINNLAMVYLAEGKDLKGIDIMVEDALEGAGPVTPYLWDTLANIAIREGRYADAENALKHAAEAAPPQDPEFQKHLQESRDKLASAIKKPTND
jgi:Tfp pilus assembly protein PilF